MANFVFYKYRFEHTDERNLFSKETGEELSDASLNQQFYSDLAAKYKNHTCLNLYDIKADRKGVESPEIYANEVLQSVDGLVFLEVRNNKVKKVIPIDQNVPQEIGHYPFCWVIIDTRQDCKAILVQQKAEAFKSADMVIGLIIDYCTRELGLPELGWKFVTEKRLCKGSIWDIVKTRTANGQDRVKSLSIKIDGKKPNENNEVDKALQTVLEKLAAPEGELKLTSDDNAKKILDDTREDVRNTVDMLIENQYRMRIGFDKSGTVEYGKEAEAVYGIADSVCEEFGNGTVVMLDSGGTGFNMQIWLDTVIPEDDAHIYIEAEKKKRNGRGKKK
ncbi:MAG: hypothetical protein IJ543_00030 [Bacteroidales bacterium]|nr:hypothetical protein [Bacteroidales bacterium]